MSKKNQYNKWRNSEMKIKAALGATATFIFWYFLPHFSNPSQKLGLVPPQKEVGIEEIIKAPDVPKIEVNHFYEYVINPALSNSPLPSLPYPPEPFIADQRQYVGPID